jgi:hypothetical protein
MNSIEPNSNPTAPEQKPGRRWWRTYSIGGMLIVMALMAGVLGLVILPLERTRHAIEEASKRFIQVSLAEDPTDSMNAVAGGYEFVPPCRFTYLLHRTFPASYLRRIERVTLIKDRPATEEDFAIIARMGPIESLWIDTEVADPQWLRPLLDKRILRNHLGFADMHPSVELLQMVGQMNDLKRLYFDRAPVTADAFEKLTKLPHIQYLRLEDTGVRDDVLDQVAAWRTLKSLEIKETNITPAGLKMLSTLTELERLRLDVSPIGDDGLESLAFMKKLKFLNFENGRLLRIRL